MAGRGGRLLGDGKDTPLRLPGERRLVILRLSATAVKDIGEDWSQCQISLVDGEGRRWLPLDVTLSNNVSRELDPKATPINGCGIASLTPLSKGENTLIEEKFLVPAPLQDGFRRASVSPRPAPPHFPFRFVLVRDRKTQTKAGLDVQRACPPFAASRKADFERGGKQADFQTVIPAVPPGIAGRAEKQEIPCAMTARAPFPADRSIVRSRTMPMPSRNRAGDRREWHKGSKRNRS